MQAVILAGGLGTRLYPLTNTIPKPMVNINGRPFLEYVLELLQKNDITDILLLTGHLGEIIEQHFGDGRELGVDITYSREDEPLGGGGALRFAYSKLADSFLLLYGDNFLLLDYKDLIDFFTRSKKQGVVVSYQFKNELDRGDDYPHNLCVDESGYVTRYEQKGVQDATHAEGGVMVFKKEVVSYLGDEYSNAIGDALFPELIRRKELIAYTSENRFLDIGTPGRLKRAEAFLKSLHTQKV